MTKLVAGNWKMHGNHSTGESLTSAVIRFVTDRKSSCEVVLCPPFTLLSKLYDATGGSPVLLGGQDCHSETHGAYTGDISASMLRDCGCSHVIVGHSERRAYHNEKSTLVKAKAQAAHHEGLTAIICVGEVLEDRESGQAYHMVENQLRESLPENADADNTVIAYEPVWAIGTGKVATEEDITAMHTHIRSVYESIGHKGIRILYGGSVKPDNAATILHLSGVDGVLVGGASLKAEDFCSIIDAA